MERTDRKKKKKESESHEKANPAPVCREKKNGQKVTINEQRGGHPSPGSLFLAHSPGKGTRASGEMADSRIGQEMHRMSREHLVVPES